MGGENLDEVNPSACGSPGGEGRTILLVVDEVASARMRAPLRFACRRARATGSRLALLAVADGRDREPLAGAMAALAEVVAGEFGEPPALHLREGDMVAELLALVDSRPDILDVIFGLDPRAVRANAQPSPLGTILNRHRDRIRAEVIVVPRHMSDSEIDLIS